MRSFKGWLKFLQHEPCLLIAQSKESLHFAQVTAERNRTTRASVQLSSPCGGEAEGGWASPVHLCYLVMCTELSHVVEGRRAWEINYLTWAWLCFCSCFGFCFWGRFLARSKPSDLCRVMYARNPLYLHEGTYLHNQKCSLCWQRFMQAHTARSLSHMVNPIRTVYVSHFRFQLRQVCNPKSAIH